MTTLARKSILDLMADSLELRLYETVVVENFAEAGSPLPNQGVQKRRVRVHGGWDLPSYIIRLDETGLSTLR